MFLAEIENDRGLRTAIPSIRTYKFYNNLKNASIIIILYILCGSITEQAATYKLGIETTA